MSAAASRLLRGAGLAALLLLGANAAEAQDQPASVPQKNTGAAADDSAESPPRSGLGLARELGLSQDEMRPDNQLTVDFLGAPLVIGGEVELAAQWRHNFGLDDPSKDDKVRFDPEAKLDLTWLLSDNVVAFVEGEGSANRNIFAQDHSTDAEQEVQLSEAWLLATNLFGSKFALQAGRQLYQDRREWWWDSDLDSVRLHYLGDKIDAFVALGREFGSKTTLGPLPPDERGVVRLLGHATWRYIPRNQLEGYFLHQDDRSSRPPVGALVREADEDPIDGRLTWIGVRATGRLKIKKVGKFYYWADLAHVSGTKRSLDFEDAGHHRLVVADARDRRVSGWGVDLGASYEVPIPLEPYVTIAYARGSGDSRPDAATDHSFVQTGIEANNGKFRGITRFRYYGEVLRPELSNIQIWTGAFGFPVGKEMWVETVYHHYQQVTPSDVIAGSRLHRDPSGQSRHIGQEIDLVGSFERPPHWRVELTSGLFRAGNAFTGAEGRWAGVAQVKLDYNF
jgi:alginate production protein